MRLSSLGSFGFLVAGALGLASCATFPSFQDNPAEGYQVTDTSNPASFGVEVRLPESTSPNFRINYAMRAIGETCAKRGFDYFNYGQASASQWQGFCSKTSSNRSLALSLSVPKAEGEKFVVENLNGKTNSKIQVGDVLLKVNGQAIITMAGLKTEVFNAVEAKKSSMTLEIERAGKVMTLEEPIADVANASMGPEDLKTVRQLVP